MNDQTVWNLLERGIKPGATGRNLSFIAQDIEYASHIDDIQKYLCADPQTSGGLLFSISKDKASDFLQRSKEYGVLCSDIIGEVKPKTDANKYIYLV